MAATAGLASALTLLVGPPAGDAAARATRGPATYGPVRSWGSTRIQSLDPWPRRAGRTGVAAADSSGAGLGNGKTAGAGATPTDPPDQVLSNETSFTRWAYVNQAETIYASPTSSSPRVARLHWYTEDGFPNVYLLLRTHWDASGREWVKLRIPMRPNGHVGWVQRAALGQFHLTHQLVVVDRERTRMYLYSNGRRVWSAPVGVGKLGTPTPAGHFWIRERFKVLSPSSGYWPYAFGTSDYSTLSDWPGGGVVGIHGPYFAPQMIPGHISHGCIRLHTGDDAWLARHVGVGTPLRVF